MAKDDCQNDFRAAAAADGVVLTRAKVPWINQRGHLGLPVEATAALEPLTAIFNALSGVEQEQAAKRLTALPGDFFHEESGVFVEVDEHQHFTSHRLTTLSLYPSGVELGFDLDEYKALCHEWAARADRFRASKAAIGFGPGGRVRQRAYNDALRDLATSAMGHPPVIRVAAPERGGVAAYLRVRDRLATAVRQ
ncbi:DUF7255 family protein [Nocardioides cavernaquae]|uniref:Uncharacterized protein n=1 Tax=Nocardioides cavernaquae TaxID=2321396 RepID=A0A3A5H8U7_9ACTN|nr:hypothetical protein [Nocardioides cavernaquae]RJS46461.1 hypothetical protein D4739_09730 [Nocardioides cavernaquae]